MNTYAAKTAGAFLLLTLLALSSAAQDAEQAQIDIANGFFRRGFFEEAAAEYRAYLESFPEGQNLSTALYRLGESEYARQNHTEALQAYEQYLARFPSGDEAARALLRKGELHYHLEQLDQAEAALSGLSGETVASEVRAGALYYLGKVYYQRKDLPKSAAAFTTLAESFADSPLAPFARYQLAFVYVTQGALEKAAAEFAEVAASDIDDALRAESQFRAAETYDKLGWYEPAITAYQKLQTDFAGTPYAQKGTYGHAWALYHAGKCAEAIEVAKAFLSANPESPEAVGMKYLEANCLQFLERYDDAIALYAEIRENYAESEFADRAHYKIAWSLFLKGEEETARAEIERFLDAHPQSQFAGEASFLLASLLTKQKNYEDAFDLYRLIAEKYRDSEFGAEALFKQGEMLEALGRDQEAARIFEQFAKAYPDHVLTEQAMLRIADKEFLQASFGDAIEKYRQILDTATEPAVHQEMLYRMAITYHNMQKFQESADTFAQILEAFPEGPHVAEAHLRIADYLVREGNEPVKAIESYSQAYQIAPKGPFAGRALKGLALARYETKDYASATDLFFRLVTEFPDAGLNEKTYLWTAKELFDAKKYDESATVLQALLQAMPGYASPNRVQFKIAECRELAGKTEEALGLYQSIVEGAPKSTEAVESYYRMGALYETMNQPDKAFEMYQQAANTNTGDTAARARFRIGEIQQGKGEFEAAARSYMRVAILFLHEELSPESLWRAGQCYEQANALEQAKKAYIEAVEEFPESEQAAKARERLAALG